MSSAVVCLLVTYSLMMTARASSAPLDSVFGALLVPDQGSECTPVKLGYEVGDTHVAFPRGCYNSKDGHKIFPKNSVVNLRDDIDWGRWIFDGSAKQIIVMCAKIALQRGDPMFGVEFFGECYTGAQPDLSQGQVTPADGCIRFCSNDVGASGSTFVYDLYEWYTQ
ncbi:hypothetical protein EGW08_022251 [Elysia chlorotica]|uniref:WSC domain-containing protein n=1 Tax=Elysia chlorotica TaxID=188477 RepID=A0A3S1B214_ELYCH|nr:hypothetical protein EGW08_022251 [Elysia chlorotica]